jgi:glycosyltransferase involved in cell wall biosynthesis
VVVVTHNYPRDPEDQAGQFIQTLITPLLDRYRFVVAAPHAPGLAERETLAGVEIVRFRYAPDAEETLAYTGAMHEQVLASWRRRFLFLRFLRAMRQTTAQLLAREKPVAVHIHWWIPGALATAGLIARRRVPYILTTHGSDVTLLDKFPWLRPLGKRLFRRAAAATAVSTYLREQLRQITGVEAVVLPMPYDDTKFVPAPRAEHTKPRITCIGRFVERKGQRYLIEAAALLKSEGLAVAVRLVGDGPLRQELEALANRLAVADRIHWTGNIPHREIPAIIAASDVVVLPSVRDWKGEVEGLGMVLVEASACARPVIGTRLAGILDAVADGQSGLLVEPNRADLLAAAIRRIVTDTAYSTRLGTYGAEFAVAGFSPKSQAEKLAGVIERSRLR